MRWIAIVTALIAIALFLSLGFYFFSRTTFLPAAAPEPTLVSTPPPPDRRESTLAAWSDLRRGIESITGQSLDSALAPGNPPHRIAQIERSLSISFPPELRGLYETSDGHLPGAAESQHLHIPVRHVFMSLTSSAKHYRELRNNKGLSLAGSPSSDWYPVFYASGVTCVNVNPESHRFGQVLKWRNGGAEYALWEDLETYFRVSLEMIESQENEPPGFTFLPQEKRWESNAAQLAEIIKAHTLEISLTSPPQETKN